MVKKACWASRSAQTTQPGPFRVTATKRSKVRVTLFSDDGNNTQSSKPYAEYSERKFNPNERE
jgi:hypothetical protein